MTELTLSLDFACGLCEQPVTVTVHCTGKGLTAGRRDAVASVRVPCPNCGQVNQVCFEKCGTVRDVRPVFGPRPLPLPSVN